MVCGTSTVQCMKFIFLNAHGEGPDFFYEFASRTNSAICSNGAGLPLHINKWLGSPIQGPAGLHTQAMQTNFPNTGGLSLEPVDTTYSS